MALTKEQIHATADTLAEQNIKPTLAEVRKALGGGSFTTISEAMKSWRQEQQQEQQLQHIELPSSLNERLQSLGAEVWQSAISIANERLTAERAALVAAQAEAEANANEAQEAVKTLELEHAELLVQLDKLMTDTDTARAEAATATAQLSTMSNDLSYIKGQLKVMTDNNAELKAQCNAFTKTKGQQLDL